MQREAKVFTTNLQASTISFATHDDREYLVAPCVALVPGVLNSDLVTLEAIAGSWKAWNRKPVVLNHPSDGEGNSISAAEDPSIFANVGIGDTWYANIEDGKLRVQVWLDIAKAKKLGGDAQRVVDRIKNNDPVEVSTGYWAFLDQQRGTHNGIEYTAVTKQIIPDHLAILPNAVGACNWGDGCGIPRVNQEVKMDEETLVERIVSRLKQSFSPMRQETTVTEFVPVTNEHRCDACQKVVAHAEPDPQPQPEPPEPVPEPPEPVPGHVPGPDEPTPSVSPDPAKENDNESNDHEEDENMDVTVQQAEILAYVGEQGWTLDQIKTFAAADKAAREEYGSVVKTHAGISDADVAAIPTPTLKALAATYVPRQVQVQGQTATGQDLMVYAGRGLANPNGSGMVETGPPRPQVLVKKAV